MKNFLISIKITLAFCVILFVGYVLVLWGISALVMPNNGRAQVATLYGKVVGASNVAQQFTSLKYFWPRPSAVNYNGGGSGASNKGVTNPKYIDEVNVRIDNFLVAHPYLTRIQVPMEMVTTSASGLDPHISVASAIVQMQRVAKARSVNIDDIKQLLEHEQEIPIIGIPVVNVLKLNIALDKRF